MSAPTLRPSTSTHPLLAPLLVLTGLLAGPASAQYETTFAAASGFHPFNVTPDASSSSTLPISGWYASAQENFCGSGWMADSFGTASCSPQVLACTGTARKFSGGCSGASIVLVRSRLTIPDLTFTDTSGGSSPVPVTLRASLTLSGDVGNAVGGDGDGFGVQVVSTNGTAQLLPDISWSWDSTPPADTYDITFTSLQPVGVTRDAEILLILDITVQTSLAPHNVIADACTLSLGNPVTGEYFDLPAGVTANAPSIGLVGNVIVQPWTSLGGGTAGIAGQPTFTGSGPLTAGSLAELTLVNAPPAAFMLLWIALAPTPFPAIGGTVHAFPPNTELLTASDLAGKLAGSFLWPAGLPSGTEATFQFIVQDLSTIHGLTLSNGLRATTP